MKQWFKKALLLITAVSMALMLQACQGKTEEVLTLQPDVKLLLEQEAMEYARTNIYAMTPDMIQKSIDAAEKQKNSITFNGLTNYLNDLDRLGNFVSVDSAEASKTEDGYRIVIDSTFEKRGLRLTLGIDENEGTTTEMTFEPEYSLSEQLIDAGGNLIIGMGTVFAVLIFISLVIYLFKYVRKFEDLMKEMKEGRTEKTEDTGNKEAEITELPEEMPQDMSQDEIIAVIAAAVAQYEADMSGNNAFVPGPSLNNGLVVRSIRRR